MLISKVLLFHLANFFFLSIVVNGAEYQCLLTLWHFCQQPAQLRWMWNGAGGAAPQCDKQLSPEHSHLSGELGQIGSKRRFPSAPISLSYLPLDLPLENRAGKCSKNREVLDSSGSCMDTRATEDSMREMWETEWRARPAVMWRHRPKTMHFQVLLLPVEQSIDPHTWPYLNQ